jgi:hypothetical protein
MPTTSLVLPLPSATGDRWLRSRRFSFEETNNLVELLEVAPGGQYPAQCLVLEIVLVVLTAFSGGTPTISIADGASATTWLNAAAVTAVGSIRSQGPSSNGKLYVARDRLTATLSGSMADGQALLMARVIDSF